MKKLLITLLLCLTGLPAVFAQPMSNYLCIVSFSGIPYTSVFAAYPDESTAVWEVTGYIISLLQPTENPAVSCQDKGPPREDFYPSEPSRK